MATMQAARLHEWGGTQAVVVEDAPVPEPKENEVRVRVRAASINPVDWKASKGYMQQFLPLPFTLGWDLAGDIDAVGSAVTDFKVGDAVYAATDGYSFAQYAAVPAAYVAPKPKSLSYLHAAAVPVAAQTAWQALFDHANLQPGQKVLIHGAAGGVGSFAVQFAKWKGAHVMGTASAANKDYVLGLGADEFIDYTTTRFEDVVKDADVVLDTVGGETLDRSFEAVKSGGVIVTVAGRPSEDKAKAKGVRATGMRRETNRQEFDQITRLIDEGRIKVPVTEIIPLDRIQEAIAKSESGHVRGKIVVEIP